MAWDTVQAKRLGAALRRLRTERGLTQEALAFQAGITKNQLQLLEAGRASGRRDESGASNPRMTTLSGLAAVLDVDVWQLLKEASI